MSTSSHNYLAVDLGASGGRVVAGMLSDRLTLTEIHRFSNGATNFAGQLQWNILGLWSQLQDGLRAAAGQLGSANIVSMGVDTWGVDFGLLDRDDRLLGNPVCYRDARTRGMMDVAFAKVPRAEIFAQTGLQFMELNSLYQLLAMSQAKAAMLENARSLLLMPDLFHWLLTGEKSNEFTNATTTQFFNPTKKRWATELLDKLGIPTSFLGNIVPPGTNLGPLRRDLAEEVGLASTDVVLPGTHDTASAVMAVPAIGPCLPNPNWCYLSSGTWSLMGVEVPEPVTSDTCASLNFTNEGGVGGSIRLLKNIAGLWLIQECRRVWKQNGREFSWDELVRLAESAPALQSLINPDDPRFGAPSDMPATIRQFCSENGEPTPDSEGAVIRCALESLALRYRQTVLSLEKLTDSRIDTIHIVGGGTQNKLLSQMTADACNRRVVAGPVEATAIGNIMMQAVAHGDVAGIEEARQVVARSFPVEEFCPKNTAPWDDAFQRFQKWM
ncbi:MAG: FGGY-family carbohydrate kinase [Pirellulaceae bacterium]